MAHFAWPLSKQTPVLGHKSNVAKKQKSCKTNCSHLLESNSFVMLCWSFSTSFQLLQLQQIILCQAKGIELARLSRWLIWRSLPKLTSWSIQKGNSKVWSVCALRYTTHWTACSGECAWWFNCIRLPLNVFTPWWCCLTMMTMHGVQMW